jgi:hypothetical protein
MIRRITRALRRRPSDGGYVLPVVLGLGLVMVALVATSLTVTVSGAQKSDSDANWNAALAAAYAGIEDYKARLENDTSYARYGNPSAPFSTGSTGLTLPTGTSANKAFNITSATPWATVPGSDSEAFFRYEVDNSRYGSTGVLRLRSTGKVGNQTRSVISDLKQDGFNDYVYYTNFEVQDPAISGEVAACGNYKWIRAASCVDIQFGASDVLKGKVHSNDRLLICSSRFEGAVTTASQTTPLYAIQGGCVDGTFLAGKPVKTNQITMPPTNSEMQNETRNDLPATVPSPGCLYTGPTTVILNSNGTMTITSPWTVKTNTAATSAGATNPAQCGIPGTAAGQLGSSGGATIPTLNHNLIYVQGVPTSSTDPNYKAAGTYPAGFTCTSQGTKSEGWSFGGVTYPMALESTPFSATATSPAYGCRNGDLYTKGTLNGQLTMASKNYVYVIGDLLYSNLQQDVLGLVGQNAVWIWNPMKNIAGSNTPTDKSDDSGTALLPATGRTIYGAILSVAHTIQVQNYHVGGARGTLKIVGSMAQNFRGTVGQGTNGFVKDYGYDTRLTYLSPPKYLTPTSTSFDTTQVAGVPAAFTPGGTPK